EGLGGNVALEFGRERRPAEKIATSTRLRKRGPGRRPSGRRRHGWRMAGRWNGWARWHGRAWRSGWRKRFRSPEDGNLFAAFESINDCSERAGSRRYGRRLPEACVLYR